MKYLLKKDPEAKLCYLTNDEYLVSQAEKCFKQLDLTVEARSYQDHLPGEDYTYFCDEWIEASFAKKATFDEKINHFEGVHGISVHAKKVYIFASHYDQSIHDTVKVLHPNGV